MKLWIDAQLSPHLAPWISERWAIEAYSVRRLGLLSASDQEIFDRAKDENVVLMTKDEDFCRLLQQQGAPPRILWVTVGNTSNRHLKQVLEKTFEALWRLFQDGEQLVELSDRS